MKPFDLQLALQGHPVVTRDGRKVINLRFFEDVTDSQFNVAAVLDGRLGFFTSNGCYTPLSGESKSDLFMAPIKKELWINAYRDNTLGGIYPLIGTYSSKEAAISGWNAIMMGDYPPNWYYIDSIKIHEYEE